MRIPRVPRKWSEAVHVGQALIRADGRTTEGNINKLLDFANDPDFVEIIRSYKVPAFEANAVTDFEVILSVQTEQRLLDMARQFGVSPAALLYKAAANHSDFVHRTDWENP